MLILAVRQPLLVASCSRSCLTTAILLRAYEVIVDHQLYALLGACHTGLHSSGTRFVVTQPKISKKARATRPRSVVLRRNKEVVQYRTAHPRLKQRSAENGEGER